MAKNYTYVSGAEFPYRYRYEHMAVTTDCVIFTYEMRRLMVLLVRRGCEPYKGSWAFPGGFLQMNETAIEGALRELREETGLQASRIREFGVFSDVHRDPRERVITIAYYALVKPSAVRGGDDADEARWFPVDSLPELAFDHEKLFKAAMDSLRRDIHFDPVGFDLLDDTFTIPDLQHLYEAILGVTFDRRNFQRKIMASGIIEDAAPGEIPAFESNPSELHESSCIASASIPMHDTTPEAEFRSKPRQTNASQPQAKKSPGRIASFFRLNRDKYKKMKEDGGKTEF